MVGGICNIGDSRLNSIRSLNRRCVDYRKGDVLDFCVVYYRDWEIIINDHATARVVIFCHVLALNFAQIFALNVDWFQIGHHFYFGQIFVVDSN